MTPLRNLLLGVLAAFFLPIVADAATVQMNIKDGDGTIRTINVVTNTDLTGNLAPQHVVCDGTAAAQCAAVKAASTAAAQTDPALVTRNPDIGTIADAACSTDNGTCTLAALIKRTNQNLTSGTITTGTAGTPSSAVLSVQGVTSMTPLDVNQKQIAGTALVADPCQTSTKQQTRIDANTASTVVITTATASQKIYVCHVSLQATGGAQTIGWVEGTGGTCGSAAAVWGGNSAATGMSFDAKGGIALGSGGYSIFWTPTANRDFCVILGQSVQTSGIVTWVKSTL